MKRLLHLLMIVLVGVAAALPAGAAVRYQLPPPPWDVGGGGGSDACQACYAAAYNRYNSTVKDSCQSFPVNITPWTIALCVQAAQGVLNQDLANCVTDVCS
jgi:hypothetical protein